jgi:hypothetical protein
LVKPSGPGDLLFSIPFKETKISSIVTGLSQTSFSNSSKTGKSSKKKLHTSSSISSSVNKSV